MKERPLPPDEKINAALSAYGITWKESNVKGLSFLRGGNAKERWEQISLPITWDRVGRIRKTRSGTEWLLAKRYLSFEECIAPAKAMRFRSYGQIDLVDSTELSSRLSMVEFMRMHSVCCRSVFVFPEGNEMERQIQAELCRIGLHENGRIKNRVFTLQMKERN